MRKKSSSAVRRLLLAIVATAAVSTVVFADEMRCLDCGGCSSNEVACGICVWQVTWACCSNPSGGAFAVCDQGEWFAFCEGSGGPMTECGTYEL